MNMNLSELINEIVSDWAYRVNDGMPNPKNPMHVKELEIVLNEMGLGHVKSEILKSINEAEAGGFTNPALNKKVRYKNANGEDKEGIVGNLLRQPEDSPGRKAAEATLPPKGSPERETMNQELGSEKDGKAKPPEDAKGKEGEDGKEGGADAEAEKKKKAAAMFDPKADPAMGARMDREKAANDKLAQKDKEDADSDVKPEEPATKVDDTKPEDEPTGPEAGPNAEPPMDEPSKPDITPAPDQDVPNPNSPNDTEVPPVEKIENTKVDIQKAENRLKALERMKQDNPEQFATAEKKAEWAKNKEILASKKQELANLESQQKFDAEKKKKAVEPVANELKNRKTADGEELDVDTTPNGSLIIGVEHGTDKESNKQAIEQIQKLPKDTKVMFVGEGGSSKDKDGNIEFGGEQDEIRNGVKGHFDNAEESSWDENADVLDDNSPVFDEVAKVLGGSKSKAKAALWSNMYGQDGPDENMSPEDYLDDEGKEWLIDQAKKGGSSEFDGEVDWNNLNDAQQKDLYELNYRDDEGYGETEISKAQQSYNGFRQKELDRKIKEAEDKGYTVIAPVGNSHVDMRRQRMKSQQKPEQPTDTKPEDKPEDKPTTEPTKPEETPKATKDDIKKDKPEDKPTTEPTKPEETPKATKDDIKKEKPGKEAKTDSGNSLYSVGGGYYSDKPNGPAKYVRTESVIEMAFDNSLNEDVFALFEKSITGTLQNGEKITVQELPPRAVKKATQRAKAAAVSSKEEPAQPTSTSTEKPAEQPKAGEFNPISAGDVKKEIPNANTDTFGSKPDIPDEIDPKDLEKFNTDIEKVGKQISDAKERGEKAPNINLCDVTVPGTNLYCDDNLGIPRAAMPQFKGKPQPGTPAADMPVDKNGEVDTEPLFKKMLEEKGIKVVQTEVAADKLKATQSELVADKVIGMMNTLENDPTNESLTAPIYVSRDGYVIDGHHRWAAITAYNAKHPDNQIPMKVQAIDMDVKEAIPMCNDFAEQQGVAAKKADANQESDIQNVTSLPEPKPEDPEEKKNWFQKQKERIQQKFKVMKEAGKQFFGRGGHKPGSVPRRSFGQALVDKIKGIPKAIKDGIIHHAVMFRDAGVAIFEAGVYGGIGTIEDPETGERYNHDDHIAVDENGKKRYEKIPQYETDSHGHVINDPETGKPMQKRHWLTGNLMTEDRPIPAEPSSDKEKELFYKSYQKEKKQIKAIVGAGKAIMITAAGAYGLSAAMGHAYTTAGQLMTSTAIELVPHTIVEGTILGVGKAALYAGAVEMNHKKKLEEFSTNLVKTIGEYISSDKEIPADVLANSMELYNNIDKLRENMDKIPDDEGFLKDYVELHDQIEKDGKPKKEMKIESLIKEIISEINLEAKGETFTAIKKDTGKTAVFKSKEARDAAVKGGTHKMTKADKEAPKKVAGSSMNYRKTADVKRKPTKAEPKPTNNTEPDFSKMKPAQLKKFVDDRIAKVESEFDKSKNKAKYATDFMLKRQAEINSNYLRPAGSPASSLGENNGGKYINQIWKKGGNLTPQEEDAIINEIMETPLAQEIPQKDRKRWAKIALETAKTEVKVLMYQSKYKAAKKQTPPYPMGVIMDKQSKSILKKHFVELMKNAKTPKQKQHYQKQLNYIDTLTESDTGVMYEREDGTVGFKHTSNKSAYNDPHNNTSVDEKIKAMNQTMGGNLDPKLAKKMQDVSKKVAEASAGIEDACRKFDESRDSMKPNDRNAQDAIIAKVVSAYPVRGGGKKNYLDECKGKPWFDKKAAELGIKTPVESEKDAARIAIACAGDTPAPTAALKVLIKVSEMLEKVTPETAAKLAPAFNLSADELLNLANSAGILKAAAKTRRDVMGEAHTELVTEIQKADKATKPPSYPYDKNADNGPHQQAYVKDFLHRMHFSSYILGERDGVSSQNIGGDNVEPEYYRQCLAELSGYTGKLDTPEGRQGLVSHLEKKVRVSPKDDSIVFVNGKTKAELGKEVYRTKGESKSVVSGLGKEMQGCLKGKANKDKK